MIESHHRSSVKELFCPFSAKRHLNKLQRRLFTAVPRHNSPSGSVLPSLVSESCLFSSHTAFGLVKNSLTAPGMSCEWLLWSLFSFCCMLHTQLRYWSDRKIKLFSVYFRGILLKVRWSPSAWERIRRERKEQKGAMAPEEWWCMRRNGWKRVEIGQGEKTTNSGYKLWHYTWDFTVLTCLYALRDYQRKIEMDWH